MYTLQVEVLTSQVMSICLCIMALIYVKLTYSRCSTRNFLLWMIQRHDLNLTIHLTLWGQVENQLADQKVADVSDKPTREIVPSHCGAEYQSNPESFRLPASSPYDNFLKAARWQRQHRNRSKQKCLLDYFPPDGRVAKALLGCRTGRSSCNAPARKEKSAPELQITHSF